MGNETSFTPNWWPSRSGSGRLGQRSASSSKAAILPGRGHDQADHRTGEPTPSFGSSPYLYPPARKSEMYVQRYIGNFPAAGEVVIFDRSWYNRAGVEPVMGFCTPEETKRFLDQVPAVEKAMVDSGILLLKYWLEVSEDEQTRRLESRINDPRKIWKLSDMDLKSYSRWYDYSRARDAMFAAVTPRGRLVRRTHRRQEARSARLHQPPAQPDTVRTAHPPGRHTAEAPEGRWLHGAKPPSAVYPHALLGGGASTQRAEPDRRLPQRPRLLRPDI